MEAYQVGELLMHVKSIWQDQSTDDLTLSGWIEIFSGSSLSLQTVKAAVLQRARGGFERPTPGQIYHDAELIAQGEAERERYSRPALPAPDISPEQRARNLAVLRELLDAMNKPRAEGRAALDAVMKKYGIPQEE